ncbi:AEC family transporter [Algoriphagus jejuensis]|uniref:AEC family transporter n=1 Tax=Algoriphagus jejuensis TaxID=419934 RepID=A0ABN1N673_9BACT
MEIFLDLYKNLLPVLAFIAIGYFLKKWINIRPDFITTPLVFFLLPVLVIYNVSEADTSKIVVIPILSFLISLAMNLPALLVHRTIAKQESINLLKSSFTFFNVLFFGIPVVSALFGQEASSVLICVYLGTALYGDIIGYFQVAKTKLSTKEALKEIVKVPYLYVFIVALGIKVWGVQIPEEAAPTMEFLGWIVSSMGMMIVGVHLTEVDFKKIKLSYLGKILGFRTVAAIVITGLFIGAEYLIAESLETEDYLILILLPFLPVASNISLFASYLGTEEERFSLIVFLSIVLSLFLVPVVAQFFPS